MPMTFRILPNRNLVHSRCRGQVTVAEVLDAIESYQHHENFAPGQSLLIDLSDVTGYERDFTKIMSLQAQQAGISLPSDGSSPDTFYLIYVAPNEMTQAMANASLRSWRDLPGVAALVFERLDQAAEVLGLPMDELAQPHVFVA